MRRRDSISQLRAFYFFACMVVVLDQISKFLVLLQIPELASVKIFRFLYLTHIRNPGICFGFLRNGNHIFFLILVSLTALIGILFFVHRGKANFYFSRIALGLVAGGILGNLFDRIRFRAVIDFIDIGVWPVFNIADSSIVVGVFLILLLQTGRRNNVPGVLKDR